MFKVKQDAFVYILLYKYHNISKENMTVNNPHAS